MARGPRVRVAFRPARARYRTRAAASAIKPLMTAAAAGALAVYLAFLARDAWVKADWLRVRAVKVASLGGDAAPPDGFERAVGIGAGDPLFGFSTGRTADRLHEQFPELAQVRVRRTLSGGVEVLFRRRQARAKVWEDGAWLGMDEDGELFPMRVFAPEDAPPDDGARPLPILADVPTGAAARPALAFVGILQRLPQPWARGFYKMKLVSSGEAVLFLKDGPAVRWGEVTEDEARVNAKAERLERVLRDPHLSVAGGASSVRFVDDRRLAVKLKDTEGS
jgi:cell division septal protein FtsQ